MTSKHLDFLTEKRLRMLDPQLHRRFADAVLALLEQLSNYLKYFPDYTDHTGLHALTVLEYCNILIGERNVEHLNVDELYVLLMGCYLHDIGMGIRQVDYEEFCQELGLSADDGIFEPDKIPKIIRSYHHEFSGCYVRKYAKFLDLPSEEHTFAIAQICRGHRRTDLFDPVEFPEALSVPSGNTICMPYLAGILRLADELDVTAQRNLIILYDVSQIKDEHQIFEFKKHIAVKKLNITREDCIMHVDTEEQEVYDGIATLAGKMQDTLDYCASVISQRTPYEITQRRIILQSEFRPANR